MSLSIVLMAVWVSIVIIEKTKAVLGEGRNTTVVKSNNQVISSLPLSKG